MHYLDLPIIEIHKALVNKEVSPLELTEEALRRASANKDNAFEIILSKEAMAFAKRLKEPEVDNLLWGIPYTIKDNLAVKGIKATGGSDILLGYKPTYDSKVYELLKRKKAILIGKTTLDEFGLGGTGTTSHLGITTNPLDLTKTRQVGGSSCGSAVCVAARITPFSIGSDTGDSVRKPASYAALVGFKPTWGLVSRKGLFSFCPSMDHVGVFTNNVLDSAIVLDAISCYDSSDATSVPGSRLSVMNFDLLANSQRKIAVITQVLNSIKDFHVREAFNKLIGELVKNGHTIDFVDVDEKLLRAIYPTYIVLSSAEATSNNANLDGIKYGPRPVNVKTYEEVMRSARTNGFGEMIKRRFILGSFVLMSANQEETFLRAKKIRRLIVKSYKEIFMKYDFVIMPAAPSIAPKFGPSDDDRLASTHLIADNYLAIGNFGGFPSITLPLGTELGMPFGVNITGEIFKDKDVLEMAQEVENVLGGAK